MAITVLNHSGVEFGHAAEVIAFARSLAPAGSGWLNVTVIDAPTPTPAICTF